MSIVQVTIDKNSKKKKKTIHTKQVNINMPEFA